MAAYTDATYTVPIQEEDKVNIGDLVYIGIFTTNVDGNTFHLHADSCTASPTREITAGNTALLLEGGNAVTGSDVQIDVTQNGISTEVRFDFSSFAFSSNPDSLYISCSVRLCSATEGCSQARAASTDGGATLSIPVQLNNIIDISSAGHHTAAGWIVLAGSLLAYLSAKVL
ncbi:pancreatic secretory granule membrane major glycoprotein GP2-like [Hyperolius riggenbachi]|uniref:pancreatic secretory granule membrane major glycoprotein GP2-like n=1 Tax=Hyperolius riggenbachi TaxID=752182 RepID=UPI0035A2AC87